MEKVQYQDEYIQAITCVEDMPAVAADIVASYCAIHEIDEKDIYPSIWDDIIDELYIKLFKPCNKLLKTDSNLYNQYDRDKVYYIYKYIYKRLCNSHCQEVNQKGFLDMSGIDKQTLYNWKDEKLGSSSFDLQEKIMEDNEQSLFSLMKDRRINPMKLLPKLNKVHGWNMPGVGSKQTERKGITAEEIRQLLPQNDIKQAAIDDKSQNDGWKGAEMLKSS